MLVIESRAARRPVARPGHYDPWGAFKHLECTARALTTPVKLIRPTLRCYHRATSYYV
jgi:hypothetical protein